MQEIIDTYKAEIRHAEEMMETWKGHFLQHTVAEQIKITYERVVEDLESHLKFHGVLQNVSKCCNSMCDNPVHKEGSVYCEFHKDL